MLTGIANLRYALDIVLCIDVTAGMLPILDTVKANALNFHKQLEDIMAEKGKAVSQVRLKAIAFRDFADNPDDAFAETEFLPLPPWSPRIRRIYLESSVLGVVETRPGVGA